MKKVILFFAIAFPSLVSFKPEVIERFGVKGPLAFNSKSFFLASTEVSGISYVQEYVPKGDNVESFHEMMSIFVYDTRLSLDEVLKSKVAELQERKKNDPVCNYELNESPDGKEKMLDFLLSDGNALALNVVEFNVYRSREITINGQQGIMVYAYSQRAYKDEIRGFLAGLKTERTKYLNTMIEAKLPDVKFERK